MQEQVKIVNKIYTDTTNILGIITMTTTVYSDNSKMTEAEDGDNYDVMDILNMLTKDWIKWQKCTIESIEGRFFSTVICVYGL